MPRARFHALRRVGVAVLLAAAAGCGRDGSPGVPSTPGSTSGSQEPQASDDPGATGRTVTGAVKPGTTGGVTGGEGDAVSTGTTTTGAAAGSALVASVDATGIAASLDALAVPGALATGGRAIVFESAAPNLAGTASPARQVYLRDLARPLLELVSVTPSRELGSASSFGAVVSSDGRFVAFASAAPDLAGGENVTTSVYLRDRLSGRTLLASRALGGALADGPSAEVAMSADGSRVAFGSVATNLVARDRNGRRDVFVFDARLGTVVRASTTATGRELSSDSSAPALSPDGLFVAFVSAAPELAGGGAGDVYLRDLATGNVTLVSGTAGGGGDGPSGGVGLVAVSQLGRRVVFTTAAGNLVAGLPGGVSEVLVADAATGLSVASASSTGAAADADSYGGSVSSDGRFVAFVSLATNLDAAGRPPPGVYVRDLATGRTARVDPSPAGLGPVPDLASAPSVSPDGGWVSWVARGAGSGATGRTPELPPGVAQVFVTANPLAP